MSWPISKTSLHASAPLAAAIGPAGAWDPAPGTGKEALAGCGVGPSPLGGGGAWAWLLLQAGNSQPHPPQSLLPGFPPPAPGSAATPVQGFSKEGIQTSPWETLLHLFMKTPNTASTAASLFGSFCISPGEYSPDPAPRDRAL